MKKFLLFLLMCVGLILSANAGINVKKTVNVLDPVLTLKEEDALIQDEDQITYNAIIVGDGSGVSALIDFDTSTWFHSPYKESEGGLYPNAKHWLQFDLKSNNNEVVFHFSGRQNNSTTYNDCPNDFVLLGTNTPEDESSWVEVQAYKDLFPNMANSKVCFYTGFVDLKGYQHIRMVVNNTTSGRTEDTYGQHFFTLSQLNFYPVKYESDKYTLLTMLVDSITTADPQFIAGTEIGQVPVEYINAYQDAYLKALEAPDGLSDAEYDELATNMLNALQACYDNIVRLQTGKYFVINGSEDYETTQGVKKAWYATDAKLCWKTYDKTDLSQIFEFTLLENGNYSIKNCKLGNYVDYASEISKDIPMVKEHATDQIIQAVGDGRFDIHNVKLANSYHTESHSGGAGVSGDIVAWQSASAEPFSSWYIEPCTEEEYQAAVDKSNQSLIDAELKAAADSAQFVYNKCFTYGYNKEDSLIFTKDQLMSNAIQGDNNGPVMSDTQGLSALLDGPKTWFHSAYSSAYHPGVYHNLQVKFLTPQQKVVMFMRARDTNSNHDTPNDVIIYATNDDAAGTDAYSSNDSWTKVTELIMDVENASGVEYTSAGIDLGAEYKYFRMVVIHTTDEAASRVNSDGIPYYNLSQFQLYPYDIDREASQYYYVEGLKDAAEHALELAAQKLAKVQEKAGTRADIEEMRAALKAVTDLVADPTPFTIMLRNAQTLGDETFTGDEIGNVDASALETFKNAIKAAETQANLAKPEKKNLEAATTSLQNAIDALTDAVIKPEIGKWYYIKPLATNGWTDGCNIYMNGSSPMYGGSDGAGTFVQMNNPTYMWRLEDNGNGTVSIRNMQTASCIWNGVSDAWNYAQSRDTLQNFTITYAGNGGFFLEAHYANPEPNEVRRLEVYNDAGNLTMYHNPRPDLREHFTFIPVEVDGLTFEINDNDIRVMTLPYALPGGEIAISAINEGVQTYAIHSVGEYDEEGDITKLNLTKKDAFAAGEPFIIVTGDPEAYDKDNPVTKEISTIFPEGYVEIEAGTGVIVPANGLIGSFATKVLEKSGYGYFLKAKPQLTTDAKISLARQTGYIDPTQVTPAEGDIDLVIEFAGKLDGVKNVKITTVEKNGSNKVYSVDGKFLGTDVKNLQKGIYIVGNKKVAVK